MLSGGVMWDGDYLNKCIDNYFRLVNIEFPLGGFSVVPPAQQAKKECRPLGLAARKEPGLSAR